MWLIACATVRETPFSKKVLAIFIGKPCIRSMSEVRLVANSAKYFFRRLTFMRLDNLTVIYLFKSQPQWGKNISKTKSIFCIIVFNSNINSIDKFLERKGHGLTCVVATQSKNYHGKFRDKIEIIFCCVNFEWAPSENSSPLSG